MRRERWWWLLVALVISVVLHLVVGLRSRMTDVIYVPPARPELEITLESPVREKPLPKRPAAKPPVQKLVAKTPPARRERRVKVVQEVRAPRRAAPVLPDPKVPVRPAKIAETRPEAPTVNTGGIRVAKVDRPMPLGMITPRPSPTPSTTPDETPETAAPTVSTVTPRMPTDRSALPMLNPLKAISADEAPTVSPRKISTPKIMRMAKADRSLAGGGTFAPSAVLGGHDGARGPEAPPDDLLFNGGGAGGQKLPKMAPRIGGGGGNPILSVPNPLAAEAVPDEHPGLGAGRGGGEGRGAGGGAGFGRGHGVGVSANGASALASLRRKPGIGLGAGRGSGRGTFAPGGGQGTGSELPGTGGTGLGYGRGAGLGVGGGFRPGVGAGGSGGAGNGGGGLRMASGRGIPFGDITGLLRGGDADGGAGTGGGPGGSGRGAGAGGRSGASGPLHIVYLLDVSGSMRFNDKIGKARTAMIKALSQLKRSDWFNIICFDLETYPFATTLQKATPDNVQRATDYINSIQLDVHPGTDMSKVLEQALALKKVSEIYLMSDGTPNGGINDFDQLRADVRKNNDSKVPIYTLALGVGERFKGVSLMKGMAEDNGGKFDLLNLKGDKPTVGDRPRPDHS